MGTGLKLSEFNNQKSIESN